MFEKRSIFQSYQDAHEHFGKQSSNTKSPKSLLDSNKRDLGRRVRWAVIYICSFCSKYNPNEGIDYMRLRGGSPPVANDRGITSKKIPWFGDGLEISC